MHPTVKEKWDLHFSDRCPKLFMFVLCVLTNVDVISFANVLVAAIGAVATSPNWNID
jgi:hypothetical protein